ncbi:MAG: phosphate ABC transporter substrate-binding protein [Ignavibacteria bacterium]|jgi:phosphate transport system substrate-binding protein|nr:phosphate ABC transporter substrate-binding protein [Ignavibacteria bacterium]HEX2961717.1 phosphate ABC transporter substrate-binding protein [Ignavibacteriales bacterium]HEX3029742.1 phosphate ABC transporter substrate-binding protein [Clostridia bacterium]MCU7497961.1 phosphate ABC transporter substrate-binding protein [Ignavibacteria bacterium]MCU7511753.1 phosphate ABC transporter substrate-binding protein [Ignavibacteria bacterium]
MSKKSVLASIAVLAALMVFGCGRSKTSVTLAGSTAFQPFAEKLAEQYMQSHNNVNITVQGGGSAVGIQSANSGAAQVGMADLVQLPDEAKGLTSVIVARDGVAIVVNPKNPITNLTTDQVRDIFNGKITNWKEVGGQDAPITVVSREAGSGTRSSFEKIIGNIQLKKDALIQDSNGTIRETVSNDPNSISYLSHGLVNEKVKPLTLDGIQPTVDNIVGGSYKLSRPIFLLVKGEPKGEIKNFIDYILSPEGQKTIKDNGLLPAKS